jgi:hypothetical protein
MAFQAADTAAKYFRVLAAFNLHLVRLLPDPRSQRNVRKEKVQMLALSFS